MPHKRRLKCCKTSSGCCPNSDSNHAAAIRRFHRQRTLLSQVQEGPTGPRAAAARVAVGGTARVSVRRVRHLAGRAHGERASHRTRPSEAEGPSAFASATGWSATRAVALNKRLGGCESEGSTDLLPSGNRQSSAPGTGKLELKPCPKAARQHCRSELDASIYEHCVWGASTVKSPPRRVVMVSRVFDGN